MRDKLGRFTKGYHSSPKTEFKKGHQAPKTAFKKGQCGKKSLRWKGGRINNNGYIMIFIPTHPFCDKKGRVRRSRFVMEKHLGRYLKPEETIHHISGITNDDRIENLQLFNSHSQHLRFHWNIGSYKNRKSQSKNI
jgi:hypothetical protein